MGYQVTIHSEAEKAKIRKGWEENGKAVADQCWYVPRKEATPGLFGSPEQPAQLRLTFVKPAGNLLTRKEWIEVLRQCVVGCQRRDGAGRGLSQAEFLALVADGGADSMWAGGRGFHIPLKANGWGRPILQAEVKALRRVLGW